jgi:hypothetical protein
MVQPLRRHLAFVSIGIAAAIVLAAPGAASAAPGCSPKGTVTVAANKLARVYASADRSRLYGCLRATKRPLLLENTLEDELYGSGTFSQVVLAGRVVGWYSTATDVSCKADCPPDYDATKEYANVANLKTRTVRAVSAIATSVAVSTGGSLAWTQAAGDQSELHLSRTASENVLVDTGQLTDVSFQNAYLLWRNAGQGRWTEGA